MSTQLSDQFISGLSQVAKYRWRLTNAILSVFFFVVALHKCTVYDWFLWAPIYGLQSILSGAIAISPNVVQYKVWRLACANVVTLTLTYILYLYWILSDLKMAAGNNLLQVDDGRELTSLCIVVLWAIMCRTSPSRKKGLRVVRYLLLLSVLGCCVPLIFWSLCFHPGWNGVMLYCYHFQPGFGL